MLELRKATLQDLPAITEIYNQAVLTTTATFDTNPKTIQEQELWLAHHGERHPVVVAIENGTVLGWASLSSWSDRCAYSDTAEISFYVREDQRGKGIGRKLLEYLDTIAVELKFHTLISRIAGESAVSIHLHQQLGFSNIGTMKEVGRKFGRRLDVHMMQKIYSP